MEDGSIISGESKIPKMSKKIKRVYLSPEESVPLKDSITAIEQADLIVFGPGSLYTSVIPNLLIPGIADAVYRSKGTKLYICNLMTQAGETNNYSASDHLRAIYDHTKSQFIQKILVNDQQIPQDIELNYKKEKAHAVFIDEDKLRELKTDILREDIVQLDGQVLRHDTSKVAKVIMQLLVQGK
jgi:uncharacterized cofD-like protein